MAFLFVYIREAHPSDEWSVDENVREGIVLTQPKAQDERKAVAARCASKLSLTMPVLTDTMDNRVDGLYAAWPERLFVIDRDRKIAYAGRQGPWGFKPEDVAEWLKVNVGPPAPDSQQ